MDIFCTYKIFFVKIHWSVLKIRGFLEENTSFSQSHLHFINFRELFVVISDDMLKSQLLLSIGYLLKHNHSKFHVICMIRSIFILVWVKINFLLNKFLNMSSLVMRIVADDKIPLPHLIEYGNNTGHVPNSQQKNGGLAYVNFGAMWSSGSSFKFC